MPQARLRASLMHTQATGAGFLKVCSSQGLVRSSTGTTRPMAACSCSAGVAIRKQMGCRSVASRFASCLGRQGPRSVGRKHVFRELFRATSTSAPVEAPATPGSQIPEWRKKTRVDDITGHSADAKAWVGTEVHLKGWVRTVRDQKNVAFVNLNDGSNIAGVQVVVGDDTEGRELLASGKLTLGAALGVEGVVAESQGGKQAIEIKASVIRLIGECPSETYPLQKKKTSLDFLRTVGHLRARTNTLAAVQRVRSTLAFATHEFFQQNGFKYLNTPILSTSDCEGAGEMFQVTTLISKYEEAMRTPAPTAEELAELQGAAAAASERVREAKEAGDRGRVDAEVAALVAAKERLAAAQGRAAMPRSLPTREGGGVDYSSDFFGERAYLTVSGQLQGEIYACAMGDVYTFGPTFRAENSNTSRHLAEFWMVEPEMAFADLRDDMACAEAYLRHCLRAAVERCPEDLKFFDSFYQKGLMDSLAQMAERRFCTISYTDAVAELKRAKRTFEYPVEWGRDLQSEHERYLTEVVFNRVPVIVTDYPKDVKAFYMRLNDDGKTVAAMDMLVPGVGELVGGSQREERLDVLERRMAEVGLDPAPYWWYLDLRKYGSVPHAGFGLGFERLVQYVTGMENIRDVIPFPRYPGSATF